MTFNTFLSSFGKQKL